MKLIAHRGNINGPNKENENKISQIYKCINSGFDVEIDIHLINKKLYLGHDKGEEIISIKELKEIREKCWIHCKNIEALTYFYRNQDKFNFFWHEKDSYCLTSLGYIWTYPGTQITSECVLVMPELTINKKDFLNLNKSNFHGICTDYPQLIM